MTWMTLVASTLLLFAVVNPVGSIPIFLQLTQGMNTAERRRAFRTGIATSAIILFTFILAGETILKYWFQVDFAHLKAAGGLLLLIIAIDHLVFGALVKSVLTGEQQDPGHIGAVPIACPILAGPGAMMTVLVTLKEPGGNGLFVASFSVVVVLGITWLVFRFIDTIYRLWGRTVCTVLAKVLCLFIAAIGMRMLIEGIAASLRK